MSNQPKQVWVVDKRNPDKPAFLHAEHLLKFSKNLKRASKPEPSKNARTAKVTEPATSTSQKKDEAKK